VAAGVRKDYQFQKAYRHKSGHPVPVTIHGLRYPRDGEFIDFHVSVTPLHHDQVQMAAAMAEIAIKLNQLLERAPDLRISIWLMRLTAWANEFPVRAAIVGFCILAWILGDRFIEIATAAKRLLTD
jgi:hypothetical protein